MRRAAILLSTFILAACTTDADAEAARGSANATRDFAVGAFDSVSLAGAQNVVVAIGAAHSVRAEGDAETIERLDIRVDDGNLRIGMKRGSWTSGWGRGRSPVTIYVTAPALAAAAIGGSGDMSIDAVAGGKFAASVGGSGDLRIGSLRVDQADFSIAGSGEIRAAGAARTAAISIAGSGDVDAAGLESRDAAVSIVGSGGARLRATRTASVSIMGSGDVAISGPAKCSVRKMGSGDVRCEA